MEIPEQEEIDARLDAMELEEMKRLAKQWNSMHGSERQIELTDKTSKMELLVRFWQFEINVEPGRFLIDPYWSTFAEYQRINGGASIKQEPLIVILENPEFFLGLITSSLIAISEGKSGITFTVFNTIWRQLPIAENRNAPNIVEVMHKLRKLSDLDIAYLAIRLNVLPITVQLDSIFYSIGSPFSIIFWSN
jgi:hypothetical protein